MSRNINTIKKSINRTSYQTMIITYVVICTLFCLLPLFITILNSIKSNDDIIISIFSLPSNLKDLVENYSAAYNAISSFFIRSIILGLVAAFIDVLLGAILAYVFTYKDFPLKNFLFMMFISIMLIPSIMGMPILVPLVRDTLHLADTEFLSYIGYLLPNFAGGQVTALFLFRTFFGQQPKDIYESAKVEGANDVMIFLRITIPLAIPIILFQFVGTFASIYNDYLWPSLLFDSDYTMLMPILVEKEKYFQEHFMNGATYAMYMFSSIPLIATSIISMKYFASGDFASGMKL